MLPTARALRLDHIYLPHDPYMITGEYLVEAGIGRQRELKAVREYVMQACSALPPPLLEVILPKI